MRLLKGWAFAVLCVGLSGCGTLSTTFSSDEDTRYQMAKAKTYCDSLPRAYAGVSYNLCLLHADPSGRPVGNANTAAVGTYLAVEFFMSGVMDTLVLPYSVYQQVDDGNLSLQSKSTF